MTKSTGRRPRRADAGAVHLTARDGAALAWIGEQYAVRADVAAVLLGRLAQPSSHLSRTSRPRSSAAALSGRTLRVQLDRWERAGLMLRERLYGRTWIIPTAAGLAFAGLPYPPWRPAWSRLAHVHAVSVVRLALEAEHPALRERWISERALARERRQEQDRQQQRRQQAERQQQQTSWHLPDGAVEVPPPADRPNLQRALHAIEVELTPKSRPNLAEVFATLTGNTVAITYFAPAEDVPALRVALAEVLADRRQPLDWRVFELPRVPGIAYEGER
jgi:hypothetical protein